MLHEYKIKYREANSKFGIFKETIIKAKDEKEARKEFQNQFSDAEIHVICLTNKVHDTMITMNKKLNK